MELPCDTRALARKPQQHRAIDRFELVLQESEAVLTESGLSGFSIPVVAQRLKFTRASIYKFFPSPYAILNELTRRHFVALESALAEAADRIAKDDWRDVVRDMASRAAEFHNSRPVGMMLALGGAVTDESFRTYALTVKHLGAFAARIVATRGMAIPSMDIAALAVDLGTTCFRQSYLQHGEIIDRYRDEAAAVMIDLLSRHVTPV